MSVHVEEHVRTTLSDECPLGAGLWLPQTAFRDPVPRSARVHSVQRERFSFSIRKAQVSRWTAVEAPTTRPYGNNRTRCVGP